jgi:hypothetical protein
MSGMLTTKPGALTFCELPGSDCRQGDGLLEVELPLKHLQSFSIANGLQ